ncbi:hypothetical protein PYW07_012652 [Mythimna separata]|uniref:Uncharacterized protein n=1 Tax=Mythimna separata TaxID=271217 RepID=A0AAD7Y8E8_MYTSE|nr:hypothetical protein PYW07_012652 [Mythimna separata]
MGSARVSNAKPIPMETTDKKSIKTLLKSLFHKKKEKPKIDKKEAIEEKPEKSEPKKQQPIQNTNTVATILENFNKLNLEEKKPVKTEVKEEEEDDEFANFTIKVIEEKESRNERIHSQSSTNSGDSGFSDNKDLDDIKTENEEPPNDEAENVDQADDLAEDLEKLGLEEDGKKKKKKQTIVLSRGPVRNKVGAYVSSVSPYATQDDSYSKISSINKHTLSGGQVLVNQVQPDNFSEVKLALESVQKNSQYLQNDRESYLNDVMELISEDTSSKGVSVPKLIVTPEYDYQEHSTDYQEHTTIDYAQKKVHSNTYLSDYEEKTVQHDELMQLLQENMSPVNMPSVYTMSPESLSNPVDQYGQEEFTQIFNNYVQKECSNTSNDGYINAEYTFPTPPRSETVPSPMLSSPASFYPTNSEYTLSPERSPIYNSDYEKYQEIPHFEEEKETADKKTRERTNSLSSMTMKQFKDMQREIVGNFSKRDCCIMTRKTCKELIQERLQKVKAAVRKDMCMQLSKIDLKELYGVLHHILISLSTSSDKEDLQYSLFGLVCERLLAQDPTLFTGDAGLSLLKSAALRCPHRPLLTRYLVQCIRTAIQNDAALATSKEHIFHEVDALGDNLLIACARAGDRCSDVLSELVRVPDNQPPLFRAAHTNADGYTALHVACSQHSATNPRLHTVHVLLAHAGLNILDGDLKGGDTALHLAVNSAHCDLQLVLMMFHQLPRKDWKSLAHHPNLSNKTPLDLARLAAKTTTRQNYPQEVLDFLKKCR